PVPQRGGRPPEGDGMSDGQLMTAVQTLERTPCAPPFAILDSRLTRHGEQRGTVPRRALLQRLEASRGTPVVTVVAPPGYGKTTILAQWVERDRRPVAWLSVDEHDNDPAVLLTHLALALDKVEPIDPAVFRALVSPGASATATLLPRLGSAVSAMALPVVLVLDDAHLLENQECADAVALLAEHLPRGSQ